MAATRKQHSTKRQSKRKEAVPQPRQAALYVALELSWIIASNSQFNLLTVGLALTPAPGLNRSTSMDLRPPMRPDDRVQTN
jgi:hypothetical protein